ncbi:fatty-acyl-CoA synthase [Crossiella equi]|uniref:Fatty-acyl-CoA synthase n=1 Tax=Crossiella equi TaxID=130796 RepID=A0ABS5A601_9PSEU|nr:AMP-binding protein [Crossiella equi]MBP2471986.1 fatty-acyl-CoA synthase [Crossiella equi]
MTGESSTVELALRSFAGHRERTALVHGERRVSYGELLDQVYRTARALDRLAVRPGHMVTLLGGNAPEMVIARYAANLVGAGVTELYAGMSAESKARIVDDVETGLLLVHADFTEESRAVLAQSSPGRVVGLTELLRLAAGESAEPVQGRARPGDVQQIRHTGGTSGHPKGITYTFGHHLAALRRMSILRAPASEDRRQLLCTTIAHAGGGYADGTLASGGTVFLHEHFDAGAVLETIERERITDIWLLPPLLYRLVDHPDAAHRDTSSLRSVVYGGCKANPARLADAVTRFGPVLMQFYGQTEAGGISALGKEEHLRPELLGTAGKPLPGVELAFRDEQGEPVPDGQPGELQVRTGMAMDGYWKQPELTAQVLHDGWVRTGDVGFLDAEGYLHLVDRVKDMIVVVGGHVYGTEVEDVLTEHPGVRSAAVFGLPDPDGAERVTAAVVADEGVTAEELAELVVRRKGAMYRPATVFFVPELPLTDTGKPDKKALRATQLALVG